MRKIKLKDEKDNLYNLEIEYYNQDEYEDETQTIYDIIETLITNKYQKIDEKKVAEEIIYNSDLHKTIYKILKKLKEEPELKEANEEYKAEIYEDDEYDIINFDEIL